MIQDPRTMKSPITGGKMTLMWELRDMEFRKETFRVMFPFYRCEDTGEQFTTTESDEVWFTQLHNQYCRKYGIPYADEIIAVRERYGLSAAKMSVILGFGPNQWRKYEQEEVPSVSNGRMIRSIMNPKVFLDMVDSSREFLSVQEYGKITSRIRHLAEESEQYAIERYETRRVYAVERGEENGFGPLSLNRLKNVLLYVLAHCDDVWCTKMNKLLFYIDFLSYREHGMAMTGLCYRAIEYGPVPERWERVYSQFDDIRQETWASSCFEGMVLKSEVQPDVSVFTEDELQILHRVCERFGHCTSRELSDLSHQEQGWAEHHTRHGKIPFTEAFSLKAI